MGCDTLSVLYSVAEGLVSIHAPRVGCDSPNVGLSTIRYSFNSRTPCGVRLGQLLNVTSRLGVSIHAPRVGCDDQLPQEPHLCDMVSIHAPRVGCDVLSCFFLSGENSFNSRTPCGVRPRAREVQLDDLIGFQFTHPVWGATSAHPATISDYHCFNSRTPCGVRPALGSYGRG